MLPGFTSRWTTVDMREADRLSDMARVSPLFPWARQKRKKKGKTNLSLFHRNHG
jgi:hypothetical protein